jgi:hypothetical protein
VQQGLNQNDGVIVIQNTPVLGKRLSVTVGIGTKQIIDPAQEIISATRTRDL